MLVRLQTRYQGIGGEPYLFSSWYLYLLRQTTHSPKVPWRAEGARRGNTTEEQAGADNLPSYAGKQNSDGPLIGICRGLKVRAPAGFSGGMRCELNNQDFDGDGECKGPPGT